MNGISEFLKSIGTTRLLAGIALLSLVGGGLTAAMFRLADNDLTVLFTDLDLSDAARITEELRSQNVDYEQRSNGRTILVPSDQVLDLRMQFASEGLPAGGIVGYELLDNQSALGTTSFLQNVNYVRALEGELSRTISSLQSVRAARVFLNLPKRELFSRETKPATASIQIDTTHGVMTGQQVRAIQFLVASAVEGLSPQRVSVIDEQGNVLASGQGDGPTAVASGVEERRQALEVRLKSEIQEILTRIVGADNARVRVSAEMNFNRVVEETSSWDPEAQVVASTRTIEESGNSRENNADKTVSVTNNMPDASNADGANNGSSSAQSRTEELVNYENSLTKRTEVQEAGRLERLSIAVVINEKKATDAEGTVTYEPRSPEELKSIETLVRAAVGFNERRGDQVSVIAARFTEPELFEPEVVEEGLMSKIDLNRVIEVVALIILGLVFFFALRPMAGKLLSPRQPLAGGGADGIAGPSDLPQIAGPTPQGEVASESEGAPAIAGPGGPAALPAPSGDHSEVAQAIDVAQIQGQVQESSIRKVGEIVTAHPEESMSILRTWLHESA